MAMRLGTVNRSTLFVAETMFPKRVPRVREHMGHDSGVIDEALCCLTCNIILLPSRDKTPDNELQDAFAGETEITAWALSLIIRSALQDAIRRAEAGMN